jgi:dienelactone hydrolase
MKKSIGSMLVGSMMVLNSSTPAVSEGKSVTYKVNDTPYEGYFTGPKEAPLVMIFHDWNGLNHYEIRRAEMLSRLGYAAFAADLFGKGVKPAGTEDSRRLAGALYQDREKMRTLLHGALNAAQAQGGNVQNAVAIGYCFGGAAVLELARSGADLKGFVTFHGGLSTPEGQDYSRTRGRLLILHGTADQVVSMDEFATLAKELELQGLPHEMVTYSGAPHAFTVFGSDSYREDADKKSWARFTRFLKETLAP